MHHRMMTAVGVMALTLSIGACSREPSVEQRDPAAAPALDRAAALQEQRERDLSMMDDRVAALERDYQDKSASTPSGTSGTKATTNLRDEVKSDMDDVKEAVSRLRTTTAENWWDRHESALETAIGDVDKDVRRFTGMPASPAPPKELRTTDDSGQPVSTAPFTSRRDKFVADMRTRIDAMSKSLDAAKATGPRKTERDDLHARVEKLADDIKRLGSASAEEWWDLSKARVEDYIDRVERSIARLDDNKR
jgi:hypothetical protein